MSAPLSDSAQRTLIAACAVLAAATASALCLLATWLAGGEIGWLVATGAQVAALAAFALVWGRLGRLAEMRESLRHSELLYTALFETVQEGVVLTDAAFAVEFVNDQVLAMTGYRREEVIGRPLTLFVDPADRTFIAARLKARAEGRRETYELRVPCKGGGHLLANISATPRIDGEGTFRGTLVTVVDMTSTAAAASQVALRHAEQEAIGRVGQVALEDHEPRQLFLAAARATADALGLDLCNIYEMTPDGESMEIRARVGWPAGVPARQTVSARGQSISAHALRQDEPLIVDDLVGDRRFDTIDDLLDQGIRSSMVAVIRLNGGVFGVIGCHSTRPSRFARGDSAFIKAMAYLLATAISRYADARALRDQRARLQSILDTTADAIVTVDKAGRIRQMNVAGERIFGRSADAVTDWPITRLLPRCDAAFLATAAGNPAAVHADATGVRTDGEFPVELSVGVVDQGSERATILTIRDVSLRRAAEDQLRQAQKMDAVGQLTGGIAHDFNNLLTVIVGNTELLTESLGDEPELREAAEHALQAAERGASLTRRLLAFSRRQTLQPTRIDARETIASMTAMLARTLGGQIDIAFAAEEDLWPTVVDRSQLETALLNLALNARDAMPDGGTLAITARNTVLDGTGTAAGGEIPPGDYVAIAVSDSGTGMSPDVAARAFEPFFTTKDVGKGTGLGLSMVYGFVNQSGGRVTIDSREGRGTVVTIYMPRAPAGAATARARAAGVQRDGAAGETLLVVEDDPAVRRQVVGNLLSLGYRIVEAADGNAALDHLRSGDRIDLLFTDLVMSGGVSGAELARRAAELRPQLPVLFTSGFPATTIAEVARDLPAIPVLMKPYRRVELARAVREALEAGRAAP